MATEYQRGYQAGVNSKNKPRADREKAIAKANWIVIDALADRAERAERGAGIGKCDGCGHWRRYDNTTHWGICTLTESIGSVNWPWRGDPEQTIRTQENFGCIRFQERKP